VKSYLDLAREALKNAPPLDATNVLNAQTPSWDETEAERLLTEARNAVTAIERVYSAPWYAEKAAVARTWLEVCEVYVRDHALEAARGWDVMVLLRDAVAELRRPAAREAFYPWRQSVTPPPEAQGAEEPPRPAAQAGLPFGDGDGDDRPPQPKSPQGPWLRYIEDVRGRAIRRG
jgi:hypothetical protein